MRCEPNASQKTCSCQVYDIILKTDSDYSMKNTSNVHIRDLHLKHFKKTGCLNTYMDIKNKQIRQELKMMPIR